jgi:hypothetical protein
MMREVLGGGMGASIASSQLQQLEVKVKSGRRDHPINYRSILNAAPIGTG